MELNSDQIKMLADLFAQAAQVSLASVAIPYFLDEFNIGLALLGITGTIGFAVANLNHHTMPNPSFIFFYVVLALYGLMLALVYFASQRSDTRRHRDT